MVTAVVLLATLVALAFVVAGFVAVFREGTMRVPWFYWTWAVVAILVMAMLIDLPMWVRWADFVILLGAAFMWARDAKETTR